MADASRICVRFTGAHSTVLSQHGRLLRFRLDDNVDLEISISDFDDVVSYLTTAKRSLERMHLRETTLYSGGGRNDR